jgi:SAM-dependent methyltransferase
MVRYQQKDFWSQENLRYSQPHLRMEKAARLITRMAAGRDCSLLDVGCGPATLARLLPPNVRYHGIDIAIHDPAPNLVEADLVTSPITFGGETFDIVIAQGFFEYVGEVQARKLAEITGLVRPGGRFLVSYVNFDHRARDVYAPYNNVQPAADFRASLAEYFEVRRVLVTSHNWGHHEPAREPLRGISLRVSTRVPVLSKSLAVQFLYVCSVRA